ncbi:hypothetical protein PR048_022596 [Dryococelus australis]|uniref:Integrase catalytic domain-containing protein n=1 Tax=Dryococelus australis TaxID=614101 RepID=A0ABQ9H1E0_9NEOP|nr:hypothetical protein PR048_022596 [Dryococelus australis]
MMEELFKKLQIKKLQTTAYNPACNDMVEQVVRIRHRPRSNQHGGPCAGINLEYRRRAIVQDARRCIIAAADAATPLRGEPTTCVHHTSTTTHQACQPRQMRSNRGSSTYPLCAKTTPLDYFLWGHMKGLINQTSVESEEELLARVMAAVDLGRPGIGDRVYQNMARRYCVCVDVASRHIEPFFATRSLLRIPREWVEAKDSSYMIAAAERQRILLKKTSER